MILEVISFLNIIQTPCAFVMMPIPRCQNPVMKWISREEKEERGEGATHRHTLGEREERERFPAGKGRGQMPVRAEEEKGSVCQC